MNSPLMSIAQPLVGGILIGLASWLLLASLGRVAGVSGITAGALVPSQAAGDRLWRWAFVAGLIAGGAVLTAWLTPSLLPPAIAQRPTALLIGAGLLVGFGTVLGSGCTSGHGVCGLGRRSLRSLVAVMVFMGVAMLTVWIRQTL